jgi:hypothetical protein
VQANLYHLYQVRNSKAVFNSEVRHFLFLTIYVVQLIFNIANCSGNNHIMLVHLEIETRTAARHQFNFLEEKRQEKRQIESGI